MKQTLQLRLGQQLTMTPQLQQAIRLLQLSSLDLQQEIQEALDSNMMLEVADDEVSSPSEIAEAVELEPRTSENESMEAVDMNDSADIPAELATDSSWDDVFDGVQSFSAGPTDNDNDDFVLQRSAPQTLQDTLTWQMELSRFSDRDYAIGAAIIDAINDDGYLALPVVEIFQGLTNQIDDLDLDEVNAVLHRIQNFDPPGIAAADLADCLAIQLRQMPADKPNRELALKLVSHHLETLAKRDLARLKRFLSVDDAQLAEIIALIVSLEPHPGRRLQPADSQYVIPDVFVVKREGEWQVSLNPDIAPRLRVNPFYSNMVRRADTSSDNVTMRNHLQEARWFIKSLHSRNDTLVRVAKAIVRHQWEFLEFGATHMKPLVLRDIAEEVSMHESTVSRVTTQKYMHTPNGIFEFKYFFTSHVSTDDGGECSAIAIKAHIKQIIDDENENKPLSDHKIATMLQKKGINVARRTIAKYRESMAIPPSNERRRLF